MPENNTTQTGTESTDAPPAETPAETPAAPAEGDINGLPEWARNAISRANSEAAEYRTKLRAEEAKVAAMKPAEDFAALETRLAVVEPELVETRRSLAMTKFNLPDAIKASVTGATLEEMISAAEALAPLFNQGAGQRTPQVPASLSGGLTPTPVGQSGGKFDPAAVAEEALKHSRLAR